MIERVKAEISRIVGILERDQAPDGSWRYCAETGILTDAYMIILLRSLEINDEDLIAALVERILHRQMPNGAWRLFYDETDGNLSATVEAYYALLYSGHCRAEDERIIRAKQFILTKGGIAKTSMVTKAMLAINGQYVWNGLLPIPIEFILLPDWFPIHFFDFVGYARVHMAPLLICSARKFVLRTRNTPDISALLLHRTGDPPETFEPSNPPAYEYRSYLNSISQTIEALSLAPQHVHQLALRTTEQFMLDRIEPNGTLYCHFTSTFFMIYALLALGYPKDHPVIRHALLGLRTNRCYINSHVHIQHTDSTVWNTALLSTALQEAGAPYSSQIIQRANSYLLSRQQLTYGDWVLRNPHVQPGGWGFSDQNTINPDIDDTTAALRALQPQAVASTYTNDAWNRGLHWVMSMQNRDGGWSAFEKNTDKSFDWIPVSGATAVSSDPSTPDLTGRTLEFLGNYVGLTIHDTCVQRGVNWLLQNQEHNGSWFGRWDISYIYGTWAAITGLMAVGFSTNHPQVLRAIKWLHEIQNEDGSWGESCRSDSEKRYIPLHSGTPTQTAWAIDTLLSASPIPNPAIDRGIQFLTETGSTDNWRTTYPTGAGLPGGFYFNYHSYHYIWPLLAFGHYVQKFSRC